jgi:hypothetical protein
LYIHEFGFRKIWLFATQFAYKETSAWNTNNTVIKEDHAIFAAVEITNLCAGIGT